MPGLPQLEAAVAADLAYLDYPLRSWVPPSTHPQGLPVHDVVIAGAGLNGLAIAYGLLRERVTGIAVIDRAAEGAEGPWVTFARMRRLRTVKTMVGPDLGLRSLSFPAWYAASRGQQAWEELDKATNQEWMDYLAWFRRIAAIPVYNDTALTGVTVDGDLLRLTVRRHGRTEEWAARKLVLATGVLGAGGPSLPDFAHQLPRHLWAHSSDAIDFSRLAGRHVAVLGAGASAFDNAAVALEAGAASVHLFARRARIEQLNIKSALEFSGFLRHFGDLDDATRWRLMTRLARYSVPPPPDSVARCTRHVGFRLSTSCPWLSVAAEGDRLAIATPQGAVAADFAILATGFTVDMAARPELAALADRIRLWRDVFTPPADTPPALAAQLGRSPYLGPSFEYRAKPGMDCPKLADIHDFGIASLQSLGPVSVGLNGMKFGPPRLVQGITRGLFLADAARHDAAMVAYEQSQIAADDTTI